MVLVNFFIRKKTSTTANIAKERLQMIMAERQTETQLILNYLPKLKHDLIEVIQKYIHNSQIITVQFKKKNKNIFILKCDICISNKNK